MVDPGSRDVGARVLRDLIDGRVTNDEFMSRFPRCKDPALRAILDFVWKQFSDVRVHTLTGPDSPKAECRSALDRCYLFLKTDLEFEWPAPEQSIAKGLLQIVSLGRFWRPSEEDYRSHGDFAVWPFLRRSDFEKYAASAG